MASLLPFATFGGARTKRKLSSMDKTLSLDDMELSKLRGLGGERLSVGSPNGAASSSSVASVSSAAASAWCAICQTVDLREVLGFAVFEVLVVLTVALGCLDWILFFKFVVEPETHEARAKWGAVWLGLTLGLLYFRSVLRSKCDANMRLLAEHAEMFVAMSVVMVLAVNMAFMMHTPSPPLTDLGFLLIPAQAVDSPWRPLSDILTAAMPVLFLAQAHFMTRENRCRVMTTFFRVATVNYFLRMCTIALTSLPGPAPHCRPNSPNYRPPQNWLDIVTRIGPIYGDYSSCGDLIFSGHMAYTTTAVLLYLRVLDRNFPRLSRARWIVGMLYLCVLATLCIAGRKHYTVDVVLGFLIAALVFFHFEHSWTPLCLQTSHEVALALNAAAHRNRASRQRYLNGKRFASIEIFDDDAGDNDAVGASGRRAQAMDEYDDARASKSSVRKGGGDFEYNSIPKHEMGEFMC